MREITTVVIPAQAGIHTLQCVQDLAGFVDSDQGFAGMGSGLGRGDGGIA